jgi:hypothetical protein
VCPALGAEVGRKISRKDAKAQRKDKTKKAGNPSQRHRERQGLRLEV